MAKLLAPYFRRDLRLAGTLLSWTGAGRASLKVGESMAFSPASSAKVYLGAAGRSVRYVGTRSDSEIYLGADALF